MTENKKRICVRLLGTLNLTRAGTGIVGLEYEDHDGDESVVIRYVGGKSRRIDVTADSGTALIKDIIRAIE